MDRPAMVACKQCGAKAGDPCRKPEERKTAPSLSEVRRLRRDSRSYVERFERAKAAFRRELEGVLPDLDAEVSVSFSVRPGLPELRRLGAKYRLEALEGGKGQCECGAWKAWADGIVRSRAGYVGQEPRAQVESVIRLLEKSRDEGAEQTTKALRLAENNEELRRRAYELAEGERNGRQRAVSLLRRCQCGEPNPVGEPSYVAERDEVLGRPRRPPA